MVAGSARAMGVGIAGALKLLNPDRVVVGGGVSAVESTIHILELIGLGFLGLMLFLALFEPMLPYRISRRLPATVDSDEFLRILGTLAGARVQTGNRVEVLTNGT